MSEINHELRFRMAERIQAASPSKSMHTGRIPYDYFKQADAAIEAIKKCGYSIIPANRGAV